ncbi:MAG: type II secretion system F family protein [Chloroflexi bacterium]|nr:type II secretion system F family protein [Chloroflexota bacterium]
MNFPALALGIGLLVSLSCGFIYAGILQWKTGETPKQRLERLMASQNPLEEEEMSLPFVDRVLKPWLRRQIQAAGRLAPARNIDRLQRNLVRAGYPYNLTVLDFLGIQIVSGLLCMIIVLYMMSLRKSAPLGAIFLAAIMGLVGFMLPDFWLRSRVRQRKAEIKRTLPDALDMLTICVDAGAGLDSAMLKISEKWKNAIATEFGKVVAEIRIGKTRREALQSLVERTDVPEVASFVAVLLQADQFGLSIANVLHNQSEQLRIRRWQRAEEEARKVPIKLLFPLIFFIFPALLVVTIGPAIPILLRIFGEMTR